MGIISWIKDTYYNHKLDNADSAYHSSDIPEAERIYLEILDKHPDAAEHLAKMYYEVAHSRKDELLYLSSLKSLLSKTTIGKEKVTMYKTRLVSDIETAADSYFRNADYSKASRFLKAIELDKRGDSKFAKKNRLYALYVNLNAVEYEYSYESSLALVDTYCKADVDQDIEDAIISFAQRLHTTQKLDRAYCLANCLARKGNNTAIQKCVSIAYDIYNKGQSSDKKVLDENVLLDYISKNNQSNLLAGLEQFAPFADKYRKQYINVGITNISSELEAKNAFAIFKNVWKIAPDISLIQHFAKKSSPISTYVFEYFAQNIQSLSSDTNFKNTLFKELSSFEDYEFVFKYFEKYREGGIDVRSEYINKAKSIITSFEEGQQLSLLNRVLRFFNDDVWAIDYKMAIGEKRQARKDYKGANELYTELVGLHANAQPRIAQLCYEQSFEETDFLPKREWISKAFLFKKSHDSLFNSKEYDKLIPNLSSVVLELIKRCFVDGIPEEAYITANMFKAFVPNCLNNYIKELKSYNDNDYVLAQLEKLKGEGIDIASDYKDVVNRICEDKNTSNQYQLAVLSKAQALFGDNEICQKFISKGIEVINSEEDEGKASACFSNVWKACPDIRLLDAFVNQDYNYFKLIIDLLIDKTSIEKWEGKLFTRLCDNIFALDDFRYSLSIFSRLKAKNIHIQKPYVATVLKALPTLGIKDRLTLINESLIKFSDNFLLDEKLAIADIYISEKDFDNAESILKELIGLHTNAEPRLASLYYEKAKKEKSLDKKEKHIINGLSYHLEHSTVFSYEEYEPIFKRLEKAYESLIDKYFSVNDAENAFKLCIGLKAYMDNWYEKYVNLKFSLISEYKDAGKKIEEIYALFNTLETEGVNLKVVKSDVVDSIWEELAKFQVQRAATLPYVNRVHLLNSFISYLSAHCENNKANEISKSIKSELISIHKNQGYEYEKEAKLSEAVEIYELLQSLADTRTTSWSKIRQVICQIKQGYDVPESEVRKLLGLVGFAKEKKDMAYRYAICLILRHGAKEATTFVNEFLSDETELVEACKNAFVKEAEDTLANLNKQISSLKTGEATLSDANKLSDTLSDYDKQLSPYLNGVHEKIEGLKSSIKSYILSKCFEEGQFDLALKYLKESGKNWYEDDVYFRNVAIACLGIVETGKVNKTNYKAIISCWLTAVYRDQLFVSSLDYTNWDDPYTFTLDNSLGGSKDDSFDSLPENVNFDEPVEGSVISIAEVQQSLLSRFELALNDKDELYTTFYEEQKDAMDALVNLNMDHPCMIAAPYLASNTRKCLNEIKSTLDYEYDNYGGENILKVGVLYNINSGNYREYKEASNNAEKCITAARSMSVTQVKSVFTDANISSVREFPDLYGSFSTEIQNVLTKITKDGTSYKTVLSVFSLICQVVNDNTLSYIFGNFINQSVVGKLNDESLDLATGLKDLVSAYSVAKSCVQLKNNIGSVLEALVGRYITEAKSSDLTTIKSVLNSTGTEFESNVANTLSEQIVLVAMATGHPDTIESLTTISARTVTLRNKLNSLKGKTKELSLNIELNQIVDKVNNKSMSLSSALQKVYSIYESNPNNVRVCNDLCTLVGMCIREYVIPDSFGKSTVMTIFNKLKYNKSTTYRNSARALKNERQEILNQLPLDARTLLTGGTTFGSELNAEGRKLKNALQLYLDLA